MTLEVIGSISGFEVREGEAHGSVEIGWGQVVLRNGETIIYGGTQTIAGLRSGKYRLSFSDSFLPDILANHLSLLPRDRRANEYTVIADKDDGSKRGVYEGGFVIVGHATVGAAKAESPMQRRQRLRARLDEEKKNGNRAFRKTVAKEEGIHPSRVTQILKGKSS